MKAAMSIMFVLLLAAGIAMAQAQPAANNQQATAQSSQSSARNMSKNPQDYENLDTSLSPPAVPANSEVLRGCLSGGPQGNYTLTDHQNKHYTVTGNNQRLWDESGHEVYVIGTPQSANSSDIQELHVTNIAEHCWNFKM